MSFADKIRQNYKPQDNTKDIVSSEEIKNSATAFVTTIKQLLLEASKKGNVVQKKKNFFSTGKRVEYKTEFFSSEYIRVPVVGNNEGEPNYSYWHIPKDDKVMREWWQDVDQLLRQEGIEREGVSVYQSFNPHYCFFVWL